MTQLSHVTLCAQFLLNRLFNLCCTLPRIQARSYVGSRSEESQKKKKKKKIITIR
jgi:hypothetical protein